MTVCDEPSAAKNVGSQSLEVPEYPLTSNTGGPVPVDRTPSTRPDPPDTGKITVRSMATRYPAGQPLRCVGQLAIGVLRAWLRWCSDDVAKLEGLHPRTGLPRIVPTHSGASCWTRRLLASGLHPGIECRVARCTTRRGSDPPGDNSDRQGEHEEAEDASDHVVHTLRCNTRCGRLLVSSRWHRPGVARCVARPAYPGQRRRSRHRC